VQVRRQRPLASTSRRLLFVSLWRGRSFWPWTLSGNLNAKKHQQGVESQHLSLRSVISKFMDQVFITQRFGSRVLRVHVCFYPTPVLHHHKRRAQRSIAHAKHCFAYVESLRLFGLATTEFLLSTLLIISARLAVVCFRR